MNNYYENKQSFSDLSKEIIYSYHKIIYFFEGKTKFIISYVSFAFFFFHVKCHKNEMFFPLRTTRTFRFLFGPTGKFIVSGFRAKFDSGLTLKENFMNFIYQPIENNRCINGTCPLSDCKPTVLQIGQGRTKVISGCKEQAARYSIPSGESKVNWENVALLSVGLVLFTVGGVQFTSNLYTIKDCSGSIEDQRVERVEKAAIAAENFAKMAEEAAIAAKAVEEKAKAAALITHSRNSSEIERVPSVSENLKKYYNIDDYLKFLKVLEEIRNKKPPIN